MIRRSDNDLIGVMSADRVWIIRHDGEDWENSLPRALQKAEELELAGHHVTSVSNSIDRTVLSRPRSDAY
jgi:hypothetical protein